MKGLTTLTLEQRFHLARARHEVVRMSRGSLEKVALKLLKSRMEQKNGIQNLLHENGILFKVEEQCGPVPEIVSEETFIELLQLNSDTDDLPLDIDDPGFEDDDLNDDGLMFT
ncbi:MAG: hypothetical protein VXY99_04315 [Pseudomonadota bacterium]|nr:hypothetical protein [Pseudomonadota bacterium]